MNADESMVLDREPGALPYVTLELVGMSVFHLMIILVGVDNCMYGFLYKAGTMSKAISSMSNDKSELVRSDWWISTAMRFDPF